MCPVSCIKPRITVSPMIYDNFVEPRNLEAFNGAVESVAEYVAQMLPEPWGIRVGHSEIML